MIDFENVFSVIIFKSRQSTIVTSSHRSPQTCSDRSNPFAANSDVAMLFVKSYPCVSRGFGQSVAVRQSCLRSCWCAGLLRNRQSWVFESICEQAPIASNSQSRSFVACTSLTTCSAQTCSDRSNPFGAKRLAILISLLWLLGIVIFGLLFLAVLSRYLFRIKKILLPL